METVHALPDIFHYWSGKYLLPKLRALGFDSLLGFFVHYISESCNRRKGDIRTIVSLGSGNSDFEIDLARRLRGSGTNNFHFVCLEMNGAMLERGKTLAAGSGLSNHFSFTECDLNNWTAEHQFDSIVAIHSLHHVVALEKLFDEVLRSLSGFPSSFVIFPASFVIRHSSFVIFLGFISQPARHRYQRRRVFRNSSPLSVLRRELGYNELNVGD